METPSVAETLSIRLGNTLVNRTWVYVIGGVTLIAGGLAILSQLQASGEQAIEDPIAEAQRMLSRAQTKVSEIEDNLRHSRNVSTQPA